MIELLLFVFGSVGLTLIIVESEIIEPVRNVIDKIFWAKIAKMIHCYMCTGFWVGLFSGWVCFSGINWWQILMAGFAGSCLSNFAAALYFYLEAHAVINIPEKDEY